MEIVCKMESNRRMAGEESDFMNPITKMSLKQQLILLFIVLVSPVFILHWYGNAKAEQILKRHVTHAYVELNKLNNLLISRDIDAVNRVTRAIIQDSVTQRMNADIPTTLLESVDKYTKMENLLAAYSSGVNGGEAIFYTLYVYDPNRVYGVAPNYPGSKYKYTGVYFYSDESKMDWIEEAERRKGSGFLRVIPHAQPDSGEKGTLCYVRAVNNIYRSNDIIGVLVATMDKKIGQSLQTASLPDGEIYLTDWSNRIIASSHPAAETTLKLPASFDTGRSFEGTLDVIASDYIYVMNYNYKDNRKLLYKIPTDTLLQRQNELKRVIQLISLVYAVFSVIVMIYFWRGLMIPLQKLALFVRSYEPGQRVPRTPGGGRKDEVGVLISSVYDTARRLNSIINDRYAMEIRQKETQLQLLYQQINPHMLYNTLESIYWKCTIEGHSESAEMIKELSKLMKIGLSRGRELITLEEELEHATAYVRLQEKRLERAFHIYWHVAQELLTQWIPKISLQPLIENAILHGIRNMEEEGEIVIDIRRVDERVVIRIEDNGYKEVDIEALNQLLKQDPAYPANSYGIRNVHQRIQLHFGSAYGLSYHRRDGGGTIAMIVLPLSREVQEGK